MLVDTAEGPRLVKLRGAAQGSAPLVAEVIVAELAEALGLRVPARSVIVIEPGTPVDDRDDELADLLLASAGPNLGFTVIEGALDPAAAELEGVDPDEAATILWLDRLVLNPDRTARNPNLLLHAGQLWLIDHGASLGFHFAWERMTEATAREPGAFREPHIFAARAGDDDWLERDAALAARLTPGVLEAALRAVPDGFLEPLVPPGVDRPSALRRRRAAYMAFLSQRLGSPRSFANEPARIESPGVVPGRPGWLRGEGS